MAQLNQLPAGMEPATEEELQVPSTPGTGMPAGMEPANESDLTQGNGMPGYEARQNINLPEPSWNMFYQMDDQEAQSLYGQYAAHPETQKGSEALIYKGQKVPKPEEQTPFMDWLTGKTTPEPWLDLSGGGNYNPLNWGPRVEMPDSRYAGAVVGGTVNTVKNIAELGAAAIDQGGNFIRNMTPGGSGDVYPDLTNSDIATKAVQANMPEYNPTGFSEHALNTGTEIGLGFLIGNKLGAVLKAEGVATSVAESVAKRVPTLINGVTNFLGRVALNTTQGVPGMMATTSGISDDQIIVNQLGLGKLVKGLPTDNPSEAMNVLNGRVNLAIDALITGGGISTGMEGLRTLYEGILRPTVVGRIKAAFSPSEQMRNLFESLSEHLSTVTGATSKKELDKVWKRVIELVSDKSSQRLTSDVGIPGVDKLDVPLDVATTIGRQVDKSSPDLDKQIGSVFQAEAKKIGQKGYEKTASLREGPAQALGNALEQTQKAMGGVGAAERGATEVQDLGKAAVTRGKTEKQMAEIEANKALGTSGQKEGNIIESVNRADDIREQAKNDLYEAIPKDAKYEGASLHKIIEEADGTVPKEITNLLSAKESDGSFKYLYNKVRPRVTALMEKFKDADTTAGQDAYNALKKIRENIDGVQINELKKSGRSDVADAAEKAKNFYEQEIAPNRQNTLGDLKDIREKNKLNVEETFSESRKKLRKLLDENITEPEDNKRLYDVLSSDEGGRNEHFIQKYREATDKAKALEDIEHQVYGGKLREFYERVGNEHITLPNGVDSFQKLLTDPQNLDRVKYMIKLAEDKGTPAVKQALKYSYSRALYEKLNTGYLTELGSEATSASGIKKLLSNDGFINAGKEIFKENPAFMDTAIDVLSLAHNIQRSLYLKAAPKGKVDYLKEGAKEAMNKLVRAYYGPLSRPGTRINTIWSTLLDVLTPQGSADRMMDALLADPEGFPAAYQAIVKGENPKTVEKSIKIIFNSLSNGDENAKRRFDQEYRRLNTQQQTEEAIPAK